MSKKYDYDRYSLLGGESNRTKKRCRSKRTCERVKEIYTGEILPICPLIKEVVNKEKFPNIPNLPKTSSKNSAIIRILEVFRELIKRQQPTKEFIKWCAHRDNVLQDCMNLIEKDLKLLPKQYEKDYPQTSQKLEKLIKRLYAEMTMYHSAHNLPAFMLPPIPDELLKDYQNVLAWQREKENPDESLLTFMSCGDVSKMASLICHYPAVAIEKMNCISNELLSLEQIEIEKAKEEEVKLHNKTLVELKEIRQNSKKPEESEQNRKTTIFAIIISFILDLVFELLVYFVPITWVKNHPNSYGLQGSIIFLIPCLIVGLFKPQSRKWCWGVGAIAFIVLLLSLMGGPADSNVN